MDFSPFDPDSPEERQKQAARERLARERRRRAHITASSLPAFPTPSYADLQRLYRAHRHDQEIRNLILEIQYTRYAMAELATMAAEAFWDVSKERADLNTACKVFGRLRHRLRKELDRIGQIYGLK